MKKKQENKPVIKAISQTKKIANRLEFWMEINKNQSSALSQATKQSQHFSQAIALFLLKLVFLFNSQQLTIILIKTMVKNIKTKIQKRWPTTLSFSRLSRFLQLKSKRKNWLFESSNFNLYPKHSPPKIQLVSFGTHIGGSIGIQCKCHDRKQQSTSTFSLWTRDSEMTFLFCPTPRKKN